ncbi:hypothetical protein RJ639_003657 [Escallonia herrerae]|uniref:CCHC-type domain-containing protein n=1 Tax=Escallonia herrerae TaxID=1293975 RepID=A0AA88VY40_9ASTE|nr:hypothetical protein RJ639_003657 [Escallonia herrerae]
MPQPFITGSRPQPRPAVRPTQYIPPQQQPAQAVSQYCTFCGMTGHIEGVCRKRKGTCFACGAQGHQMRDCPKNKGSVDTTTGGTSGTGISSGRRVNKPMIKARAFALGPDEVHGSLAVVGGTMPPRATRGGTRGGRRDTEERRATRFKNGLRYRIRKFLTTVTLDTYGQVLDKAQRVEKDVEAGRKYYKE